MKAVISFLIFILEGIARILIFLLTSLGLWIPALFSLLFVLICAITKTPFAEVSGFFFVGLSLTFLMSIGISVHQVLKNRVKKRTERGSSKNKIAKDSNKKKRREKDEEVAVAHDSDYIFSDGNAAPSFDNAPRGYVPPQGYVAPQPNYPQSGYAPPQYNPPQGYPGQAYAPPQGYPQQGYAPQSQYNASQYPPQPQYNSGQNYNPQQGYNQPQYNAQPSYGQQQYNQPVYGNGQNYDANNGNDNVGGYNAEQNGDNAPKRSLYEEAKADFARSFGSYNQPQESAPEDNRNAADSPPAQPDYGRPLVFRTRSDPSVLIYEYPDRYVFYRRGQSGNLEYIKTENK